MALIQCDLQSETLRMPMRLSAILPADTRRGVPPRATLWLLHGRGQDGLAWLRYTSLERYAEQYGVAVLLPDAHRTFYADMRHGIPYFTYISEELPALCRSLFHLNEEPEANYVFGLSMGGYGALRCALTHPERYAGCAAFSSMPDLHFRLGSTQPGDFKYPEFQGIYGLSMQPSEEEDLYPLAKRAALSPHKPAFYLSCGTEDGLYPLNVQFRDHLQQLGFAPVFEQWPGGHEWAFWDESLRRALACFFDPRA